MAEEAQQSWLAAHWKLLAILASVFVVIILVVVLAVVLSRGPLPCEKGDGQKDPEITAISIPASSANGLCPDIDGNTNITIEGENFFRHKVFFSSLLFPRGVLCLLLCCSCSETDSCPFSLCYPRPPQAAGRRRLGGRDSDG
jgi:hypothetical protein